MAKSQVYTKEVDRVCSEQSYVSRVASLVLCQNVTVWKWKDTVHAG